MTKKKTTEKPIEGQYTVSTDEYNIPEPLMVTPVYKRMYITFKGKQLTERQKALEKTIIQLPIPKTKFYVQKEQNQENDTKSK